MTYRSISNMDTAVLVVIRNCEHITKYHNCSLYSSWEMNLNIRVEVRDDANVDKLTDERTNERMDGITYLLPC